MKYQALVTNSYKTDYKKCLKRGKDITKLNVVVNMLLSGKTLPRKNKDHALVGSLKGCRECHIEPDWLLIYQIQEEKLILVLLHTGKHNELFKKRIFRILEEDVNGERLFFLSLLTILIIILKIYT